MPNVPKLELFEGPMDGDHKRTIMDELYYESGEKGFVHSYVRVNGEFRWQGLIPWREGMLVLELNPGRQT